MDVVLCLLLPVAQIEGVFRVEVPAVLLGYSREVDQVLETSSHTHLQLFVTLEPTLSILPPLKDKVSTWSKCLLTQCSFPCVCGW